MSVRNSVYKLPPDLSIPIGSPLECLIVEVFMSGYEEELFHSGHPLLDHVFLWRRYVDDVFCIWTGPVNAIQDLVDFLNSLYPSIEFTLEVGGSRINFLDLTITSLFSGFKFAIFRKNTTTDILIHGSLFCPFSHKYAAGHYFIHHLVSLPLSPSAFAKEVSKWLIIYSIP